MVVNGSYRAHAPRNSSSPRSAEMKQIPEQEPLIRQHRDPAGSMYPSSDAESSRPDEMKVILLGDVYTIPE